MRTGLEQLTDTTGVVRGTDEVKNFISMCHYEFNVVNVTGNIRCDYIQYTLLTDNRIAIFGE